MACRRPDAGCKWQIITPSPVHIHMIMCHLYVAELTIVSNQLPTSVFILHWALEAGCQLAGPMAARVGHQPSRTPIRASPASGDDVVCEAGR